MLNKSEAPDDCKSVLRGLFTKVDDNLVEVVRNLVSSWNDPNIRPEMVCDVQKGLTYRKGDGKHNLFITAVDREASNALIVGSKQYLNASDGLNWGPFSTSRVCETFIEGLPNSGHDLTQVVKHMVQEWNDPEVDPSFIEKVIIENRNGKELCVVRATSPQKSRALVKAAKRHLTFESGLKWYFTRRFEQN